MNIIGIYISKFKSYPRPPGFLAFSYFLCWRPRDWCIFHILCWYHPIYLLWNQFSPPIFPLHRCSDPCHFSLLLFITDETREKKYYTENLQRLQEGSKLLQNPLEILSLLHCPVGMISEYLFESPSLTNTFLFLILLSQEVIFSTFIYNGVIFF